MDYLDFRIAVDNAKEAIYQIDSFIRILKETLDKNAPNRESIISSLEKNRKDLCEKFGSAIELAIEPEYFCDYPNVVKYIIAGLSSFYNPNDDENEYVVQSQEEFYNDLVDGYFD